MDEILTVEEVAVMLKTKKCTIYKMCKDKKIPALKVAHKWRFKKSLLMIWIDEQVSKQIKEYYHG